MIYTSIIKILKSLISYNNNIEKKVEIGQKWMSLCINYSKTTSSLWIKLSYDMTFILIKKCLA